MADSLTTAKPSHASVATGNRSAQFNYSVHGARGLFAGLVYLFHVVNSGLSTLPVLRGWAADFALRTPEYGVELFFCISGYVIAGTLRRSASPVTFLEDRAIRIFPVLWAAVLAVTVLGLVTGTHGMRGISAATWAWLLPANLAALPGILPIDALHPAAWSLSYELTFYLACAIGWQLRRTLDRRIVLLAIPLAAGALAFYPRAVFLLAGMLVAEGTLVPPRLARHPIPALLLFLACWRGVQMLSLPAHIMNTTLYDWAADWRLPLAGLGFVAAMVGFAGIVAGHGALGQMLRTRPLQFMGTISYSFYLWHPIVMSGVKTVMLRTGLAGASGIGAQAVFLLLALPPALLAATVSQHLLERATGAWLRRRLHHRVSLQTMALSPTNAPPA